MPKIHPTAQIDPGARIADDVEIGPGCIIADDAEIGPGTVLREYVIVREHTTLGAGNFVDAHSVLGGWPQDRKFDPSQKSFLRIGDENIFREGVTISRATGEGEETRIGSRNFWMAGAHAGHNATVGNGVTLVNGAVLAGHTTVEDGALLSAYAGLHQFCTFGRLAMVQGNGVVIGHMPPYTFGAGVDAVHGLNLVGLRRAEGIDPEDIRQIREAFNLLYRKGLPPARALEEMDARDDWNPPAAYFRDFIRRMLNAEGRYKRSLASLRRK